MSPAHLWRFFLAASVLAHLWVLTVEYRPAASVADQEITVPVAFDTVANPTDSQGFALRQQVAMDGAPDGRSPDDFRRLCRTAYLARVKAAVEKRKFQPPGADFSQIIGNVRYAFTIDGQGRFLKVRLLRSSGSQRLDQAARAAISKASGRIRRPAIIGGQPIAMTLTVKYQYGL